MWPDSQFPAHLVTFTEEIFNEIFIKMSLLYLKAKVVCPPKSLCLCYIKLISLDDTTDQKNLHYLHRNFKLIHESFVSHRWASLFGKINKNVWPDWWICYIRILLITST